MMIFIQNSESINKTWNVHSQQNVEVMTFCFCPFLQIHSAESSSNKVESTKIKIKKNKLKLHGLHSLDTQHNGLCFNCFFDIFVVCSSFLFSPSYFAFSIYRIRQSLLIFVLFFLVELLVFFLLLLSHGTELRWLYGIFEFIWQLFAMS